MKPETGAFLETLDRKGKSLHLRLSGVLRASSLSRIWNQAEGILKEMVKGAEVRVDASRVIYCDGAGIGMLLDWEQKLRSRGGSFALEGLKPRLVLLLEAHREASRNLVGDAPAPRRSLVEQLGSAVDGVIEDLLALLEFVGELVSGLVWALLNPRQVRWRDGLLHSEQAGAEALPIVGLISFLIGLIIAFQGVIPLREFGAETLVADLTAFSLVRELGPLITAIILAGRSGAAFAAELGSMKISEEINALTTMGFSPMRFLVVPRVVAVVAIMPLLTVFSLFFGLLGGAVVYLSLGYSHLLYIRQVIGVLGPADLAIGLFKATVFGLLVAAVGCMRGLQTSQGPSDVGRSATRAVVSGITLIVIADGVFTVFYYMMGT